MGQADSTALLQTVHPVNSATMGEWKRNTVLPKPLVLPGFIKNFRPVRDVEFWARAARIYGSYKLHQMRQIVKHGLKIHSKEKALAEWSPVHELNSQRMIEMCLGLRGFYLKTGQFLGTRHDFMPSHYTTKLSRLHDDVPPLSEAEIREVIEREMGGKIEDFFTSLDLEKPVGSASVAQVHVGVWRDTGEKVAVKIQYPNAEPVMMGDLNNIRMLAEVLQRTDLKVDVLSAIKELQKQIKNEFDFKKEARNMELVRTGMLRAMPDVEIPRPIWASKRALVMTFVEGENLSRLAEFRDKSWGKNLIPKFVKQRVGRRLLDKLAKAWGHQIFVLRAFNADPRK
jgi:predicted unusual protein kinase regulating ubiquinone biosynthesis (AarF/ABC1/UbiB family)